MITTGPGWDDALLDGPDDDAYTSGWIWSYPLRDALRAAVAAGDLTRQGLLEAVTSLEAVDYEFMLPPGSGAFGADSPAGQAVVRTVFRMPESGSVTGATSEEDFFNGVTAGTYAFERPCYEDW
jgi:hypothetical protein